MKYKLKLFTLLAVVCMCNGHLRILGDILSSAHDRIHSTVENVAGTVLGGITHGLNLNVEGHVGVNAHRKPAFQPNSKPGETVVVVIKEEDNDNEFRPPYQDVQGHRDQQYNNGYRPNNNPYLHNQRPNYDIPNQGNNFINGYPNRPNNGNRYPNNQYHANNNYNPNYQQGGNNFKPPPNRYPENEHNNGQNENFNQHNGNNNYNGYRPDNSGFNQVNSDNNNKDISQQITEEPTEFVTNKPDDKPHDEGTTPRPVDDDAPLFIPLNDYSYGGDKINVTAPKRDTNNNKAEEEDEDFGIDVRIKDT